MYLDYCITYIKIFYLPLYHSQETTLSDGIAIYGSDKNIYPSSILSHIIPLFAETYH